LRGNSKVIAKVDEHLKEFGFIRFSIITYYEILNGLLYKDARMQLTRFEDFAEFEELIEIKTLETYAGILPRVQR